ncbi:MAG TPA: helix-turn-helix domain-containing protein [Vicinamibacterales bacterium]
MSATRRIEHQSEFGCWEMCRGEPAPGLRGYVREYTGWFEHMASPLCRRELPTEIVPVIINFGAPIRIFEQSDPTRWTDVDSFAAGPYDTYVLVGSAGPSGGVQINFTMLGARLFLGRPLVDLTNRVVALDDLFGAGAERLRGELHDAGTWPARFAILDREIGARISAARSLPPAVVWAWRRLTATGGRVSIGAIVADAGCSQKHFIAQFTEHIGLTPKVMSRVLRFGAAVDALKTRGARFRLADIAADCGYFDQAHFSRDFRAFAGVSPSALLRAALPDEGGFAVTR